MNPLSVVRSDALLDPELQKRPAVYMTLAAISTMTTRAKDGYCYFKQETIAEQLGKSRQAVSQHINMLAELGYIEIISQTYRGFKSNNAYRVKYDGAVTRTNHDASSPCNDASSPCNDASSPCTTTQAHLAAKCSSINAIKEKKTLTRDEFLRLINGAYQNDEFEAYGLGESIINNEASKCWDYWQAKGEIPTTGAIANFRVWLNIADDKGKFKKHRKDRKEACQGDAVDQSLPELQPWHERMEQRVGGANFRSWFRSCWINDNGQLCAPMKFHADKLKSEFAHEIADILPDVAIIHQPYQPQPEKELEYA